MTHDTTRPPIGRMVLYWSTNAGSVVGASGRSSVITKNCGQNKYKYSVRTRLSGLRTPKSRVKQMSKSFRSLHMSCRSIWKTAYACSQSERQVYTSSLSMKAMYRCRLPYLSRH